MITLAQRQEISAAVIGLAMGTVTDAEFNRRALEWVTELNASFDECLTLFYALVGDADDVSKLMGDEPGGEDQPADSLVATTLIEQARELLTEYEDEHTAEA